MSDLVERLRWNVKNSATASRLNMAIDQEQAAARIEELERALADIENYYAQHYREGEVGYQAVLIARDVKR